MLKQILKIQHANELGKDQQKSVNGGQKQGVIDCCACVYEATGSIEAGPCVVPCGPGGVQYPASPVLCS